MEVKHYKDQEGNWYREIVEKNATAILNLRDHYKSQGFKTWLNPYDVSKWMLTVCTGKAQQ